MSKEILSRHWKELSEKPNYLNVALGTKFKADKDTHIPAIVVYVSKKVATSELTLEQQVPKEIEGVVTDMVELAPTTWKAGKTAISQLHPEEQLRRLGLVKEQTLPKAAIAQTNNIPSGAADWTAKANAIQDQKNCGSCVSFDVIGVWETKYNIMYGNLLKLSEGHLFFCTVGADCENGTSPENVLTQAMNGVCLESCLPYKDADRGCAVGICANWWVNAKKLSGWNVITDSVQIKTLLDIEPLCATFDVHQSFMNYVSGVYKNLGTKDPVVGGHGVGCLGYSDTLDAHLIRNSWSTDWGHGCIVNNKSRSGYCWMKYGELDAGMYQIGVTDAPVLGPTPVPPVPSVPIQIITKSLPNGKVHKAYNAQLKATGGCTPYAWTIKSGSLPNGLFLSNLGVISGKPTSKCTRKVTFGCSDCAGNNAKRTLSITIKRYCFIW